MRWKHIWQSRPNRIVPTSDCLVPPTPITRCNTVCFSAKMALPHTTSQQNVIIDISDIEQPVTEPNASPVMMPTSVRPYMLPPGPTTQHQHQPPQPPHPPPAVPYYRPSSNAGQTTSMRPTRRIPQPGASASRSSTSLAFPHSATIHNLTGLGAQMHSSCTWTTSSGDLGVMSDTDELHDGTAYVQEYNRVASKVRFPKIGTGAGRG